MRKLLLCLIVVFAAASTPSYSSAPSPISPARLVNDFAGLFTPSEIRVLEDSLTAFDRATSTQIVVVTMADLHNAAPSRMAFDIMNEWGVGRKEKNNGVVILIKPRNDTRGEVFIATGLGLEGVLPDGKVTRIIDNYMMPHLKRGNYFAAAEAGAAAVRAVTRGEFDGEGDGFPTGIIFLFVGLFVLFVVFIVAQSKLKNRGNGGPNDQNSGSGGGGMFFPPIFGGFGGSSSGSGGGGFGGFGGGGSFGGGGGRSF